jgi:hypothetical protein
MDQQLGAAVGDLEVRFRSGTFDAIVGGANYSGPPIQLNGNSLSVPIPSTVVVGLSAVQVIRPEWSTPLTQVRQLGKGVVILQGLARLE